MDTGFIAKIYHVPVHVFRARELCVLFIVIMCVICVLFFHSTFESLGILPRKNRGVLQG